MKRRRGRTQRVGKTNNYTLSMTGLSRKLYSGPKFIFNSATPRLSGVEVGSTS